MSRTTTTMKPLVEEAQLRHAAAFMVPQAAWRTIVAAAAEAAAWHRQRRRTRRNIAALSALSDHVLKDIGIHRSEILSIVHFPCDTPQDRL